MIGIYAIWFEELDKIYIGQSINIEKRIKEHEYLLKFNKHKNDLLQEVWNKSNKCEYVVLEICQSKDLDNLEIRWIKEFDSYKNGLNKSIGGFSGWSGTEHHASIYSKIQILKVFSYLYKTKLTSKEISILTKVSKDTVDSIRKGRGHTWIQEDYPEKYKVIYNRKNTEELVLKSPLGEIFNVKNLREFCFNYFSCEKEAERARRGLSHVKSGRNQQYKGWTIN